MIIEDKISLYIWDILNHINLCLCVCVWLSSVAINNFPRNFTIRSVESYNYFDCGRIIIYQMAFNNVIISSTMMDYRDENGKCWYGLTSQSIVLSFLSYKFCVVTGFSLFIKVQWIHTFDTIFLFHQFFNATKVLWCKMCTNYIESNHVSQFGSYLWPK